MQALASRPPVEVVLARDDGHPLLFDITSIPVERFDPADTDGSTGRVRALLRDRLRERELLKDARAAATLEALAPFEVNIIKSNAEKPVLCWKSGSLPSAVALGLPGLLEKKVLRRVDPESDAYPHCYAWTTFGRAIADKLTDT